MEFTSDPATLLTLIAVFLISIYMGCFNSRPQAPHSDAPERRAQLDRQMSARIANNYRTLQEVEQGLRRAGLESSDLIIAIDFTKSNLWQGERSFGNRSLHALAGAEQNMYQQVISTMCDVLVRRLDDDTIVPVYGFGDMVTQNRSVFLIHDEPCSSKEELLAAYADAASSVTLSGPTSFAPIIHEAVDVVRQRGKYHILVIIADGAVDTPQETIDAIVYASRYPLSIVMIGVGDGPWDTMEKFDDDIPQRAFDNFQFVNFTALMQSVRDPAQRATQFALEALMELPEQYKLMKELGYLKLRPDPSVKFASRVSGRHANMRRSFVPGAAAAAAQAAAAHSAGAGAYEQQSMYGGVGLEGIVLSQQAPPGGAPNPPPAYAPAYAARF